MKKVQFGAILWLVVALVSAPLMAQNQEGSVAIAANIRPENEDKTLSIFSKCVVDLTQTGLTAKDAVKACKEASEIEASKSKKIANEAADATKASRPVVITHGYGYSYGVYYNNRSRNYSRSSAACGGRSAFFLDSPCR